MVHRRGELVVEHRHLGRAGQAGSDRLVGAAVGDGEVEALLPREAGERGRAARHRRALPRREAPPCAPTTVWGMPKRSSSPTVWANSREVTVTSWPRSRIRAISGRKMTA